ncbi:DinB family protein [Chitinophaga agrisoli]|uniref:DinB family protein n=1 Tax=Chitinophaga agrisoli TaxID=2607653 RepID=A0A5B2VWX3_9BACT|nr:DinB family protein [Chitinophaga agrisoli]KAA2242529.1 DinB family protein [Chitinophaga agrisoli]
MSHLQYLATSLENLYNGSPWIEVTFTEHLKRVSARQAVQRFGDSNCIWQIVNHLIYWHQRVLRYMNNEQPEQDGDLPDFYLPENHGEENWQATQHRMEHSVAHVVAALRSFPEDKLYELFPGTTHPAAYYFHGIVDHAAYHLGQIVLLEKYSRE